MEVCFLPIRKLGESKQLNDQVGYVDRNEGVPVNTGAIL